MFPTRPMKRKATGAHSGRPKRRWPASVPQVFADPLSIQVRTGGCPPPGLGPGLHAAVNIYANHAQKAVNIVRELLPRGPGTVYRHAAMGVCLPPDDGRSAYFPACPCPEDVRDWTVNGNFFVGPSPPAVDGVATGCYLGVYVPVCSTDRLTTVAPPSFCPGNYKITEADIKKCLDNPRLHTVHSPGQVIVQNSCWPVRHTGPMFVCHVCVGDAPRHAFGAISVQERRTGRSIRRDQADARGTLAATATCDTGLETLQSILEHVLVDGVDIGSFADQALGVRPLSAPPQLCYDNPGARPSSPTLPGAPNPTSPSPRSRPASRAGYETEARNTAAPSTTPTASNAINIPFMSSPSECAAAAQSPAQPP